MRLPKTFQHLVFVSSGNLEDRVLHDLGWVGMIDILPRLRDHEEIEFLSTIHPDLLIERLQWNVDGRDAPELALTRERHRIGAHQDIAGPFVESRAPSTTIPASSFGSQYHCHSGSV